MHRTTTIFALLAVAALSAAPALADGSEPAKVEKPAIDVESRIADFKAAAKAAAGTSELAAALTALAGAGHHKAAAALAPYVAHQSDAVAEAAINGLGVLGAALELKYKPACTRPLLPLLKVDERQAYRARLAAQALERIGDDRVVAALTEAVESKSVEVAKAAIVALKTLRHRNAIEPLIKALVKLEWAPRGGGSAGSGTPASWGSGDLGDELAARIQALKQPLLDTLAAITGQSLATSQSYRKWWKDNQRTFRIVPPAAAAAKAGAKA
jgi:hypothetical protein